MSDRSSLGTKCLTTSILPKEHKHMLFTFMLKFKFLKNKIFYFLQNLKHKCLTTVL